MIVLKTNHELALMREACEISAGALKIAGEAVEPGVTTAEIDKIAYDYIKKCGAEPNFLNYGGFPAMPLLSQRGIFLPKRSGCATPQERAFMWASKRLSLAAESAI